MIKCLNIGKNIGQPIYRSISSHESHGGASEGIKGGVTTVEDERGPGLDFSLFSVRQSSVRGCRFSLMFVYFIIEVFKCSPVPASFFPIYELLHW